MAKKKIVKQKGGFLGFLPMMMNMFNPQAQRQQRPQYAQQPQRQYYARQRGGLYVHRKKRKQKGGTAYTPIEEIRRRHFRKIMLKAMKNNKKYKK